MRLFDVTVLARPADVPGIHFEDACRPVLAQDRRQAFVAQAVAGGERIGEVILPIVRCLLTDRGRDRHHRHDGAAAAADQAAIGENDRGATLCRFERRIHASAAGADNQDIGFKFDHARNSLLASPAVVHRTDLALGKQMQMHAADAS